MVDVTLPLKPPDARRLIDAILAAGLVLLSDPHGVREMEKDDLDMGDALNVLRAGIAAIQSGRTVNGGTTWKRPG